MALRSPLARNASQPGARWRAEAWPRVAPLLLLASALLSVACGDGPEPLPTPDPATQRTLAQGKLVGFSSSDHPAHLWRGIPFAEPPVGPLRWRAPQPPGAWQGKREALAYGPECVQFDPREPTKLMGEEDCLTLNVHAPKRSGEAAAPARLPVMVWIHGGGNSIGGATMYDASRLAAEGEVVVVTIQYRLGILGWFSHPALRASAANRDDASGNFGTLDTIRALEWVQSNIAAFGGDPGNVTVFGESAGGIDVYALLLSKRVEGLFHRAIAQSPVLQTFTRAQAENYRDAEQPGLDSSSREVLLALLQSDGSAQTRAAARARLDALSLADTEDWLRGKSVSELLSVFDATEMAGMYFAPFVFRDGHVIRDADPFETLASRQGRTVVPVMVGSNFEETKLFSMMSSPHVRRVLGVPVGLRNERLFDLGGEYGGLLWGARNVDMVAAALRRAQSDVWSYRFDWDEEGSLLWVDLGKLLGASHAVEMLFVFGFTDLGRWTDNAFADPASAEELSRAMRSYWVEFARTGRPGRGSEAVRPEWTPWQPAPGEAKRIVFDSPADGGIRMEPVHATVDDVIARVATDARFESVEERCEVYRSFATFGDGMTPEVYAKVLGGACAAFPLEPRPSPFTVGQR